jgi:ATP-dependent RNA helicase RhlE
LADFTEGRVKVLVATDIVARGIDVEGISHVINFDLSDEPENHIHRIGRTARAGAEGIAISFCDADEVEKLWQVERLHGEALPKDTGHPAYNPNIEKAYLEFSNRRGGKGSSGPSKSGKSGGNRRRGQGQGGQGGQNANRRRRGRRGRRPVGASA